MPEVEVIAESDELVEQTRHLPEVRAYEAIVARAEISVDDVVAQRDKIKAVQAAVMKNGVHYGLIAGIKKPSLFKPGAEVLCTTFRFAPAYKRQLIWEGPHLTVISECTLTHAPSGVVLGDGGGLCTTRESKYAWRKKGRACPACGAEAIIKGKAEYGGGWVCWKNHKTTPGCGETYEDGDIAIEGQVEGRVENEDIPDTFNTVLKMADKRALVAAILVCTAASDLFTQDVEDVGVAAAEPHEAGEMYSNAREPVSEDERRLLKMRRDVADLFRSLDRARGMESGSTEYEAGAVLKGWFGDDVAAWDALTEEQTERLGKALGHYLASKPGTDALAFDAWVIKQAD